MKKALSVLLALALMTTALFSGAALAENKKLSIVTTIFPIYDWVRQIVSGNDSVEITLLLNNGTDLHSYQPAAQDILKISTADLFIYVGGESDEWVEDVLAAAMNPDLVAINLVEAMGDAIKAEEIVEGMEHEHEHEHEHEEEEEEHEHEHEHDHEEEETDEHVWLSLRNADALCKVIAEAMSRIDPAGSGQYQGNLADYSARLTALDKAYAEMVDAAQYKTVLFGDRFPFRYLVDDYGLTYFAAFSGCSAESEASFQTIVFLARKVDELGLPAVLTIEHPKTRIAETVVAATQAKDAKILSMDSMQSVTTQDVQSGLTYLSVMENNLNVLREALNK